MSNRRLKFKEGAFALFDKSRCRRAIHGTPSIGRTVAHFDRCIHGFGENLSSAMPVRRSCVSVALVTITISSCLEHIVTFYYSCQAVDVCQMVQACVN